MKMVLFFFFIIIFLSRLILEGEKSILSLLNNLRPNPIDLEELFGQIHIIGLMC